MRKQDVSPLVWGRFHKRGYFSFRYHANKFKNAPMPLYPNSWKTLAGIQAKACLFPDYFHGLINVTLEHNTRLSCQHDNEEWLERNAPAGCISPMGTQAAILALLEAQIEAQVKGHFKAITLPFLWATFKELYYKLMNLVFILLAFAYPVSCVLKGSEYSLVIGILIAAVCGVASAIASDLYRKEITQP